MKELSIEEKAKRYDEALKYAMIYYKDGNEDMKMMMKTCFPVLVEESEDERIIKELIFYLRYQHSISENFEDIGKWIAWLEKQGEQKPKFRVGDTIKCKYDDRQFTIKSVDLDKGTYTYTQEGCGNDIDYADEEFELVEQNPAWSEEDERKLGESISLIRSNNTGTFYYEKNELISFLKSLKERYTWRPSDEQIKTCKEVYADILSAKGFDLGTVNSELNRLEEELKKLREEQL